MKLRMLPGDNGVMANHEDVGFLSEFSMDPLSSLPLHSSFPESSAYTDVTSFASMSSASLPKEGAPFTPSYVRDSPRSTDEELMTILRDQFSPECGGTPAESQWHIGSPPLSVGEGFGASVSNHEMSLQTDPGPFSYNSIPVPEISFVYQPVQRFRFRYLSEEGSHGHLTARNSTSHRHCCPTVEVKNTVGDVEIRVSLYTLNDHKPHELLRFHQVTESRGAQRGRRTLQDLKKEMKFVKMAQSGPLVELRGLGITRLTKDDLQHTGKTLEEAQEMQRHFNTLDACLRVSAYQGETLIAGPIFSEGISNPRRVPQLKIDRRSILTTQAAGEQEIWLLTDKVKKSDIEVRVSDGGEWQGVCSGVEVYHQFLIICRTPPYPHPLSSGGSSFQLYLYRPSDEAASESYEIRYLPDIPASTFEARKRKKTSVADLTRHPREALEPSIPFPAVANVDQPAASPLGSIVPQRSNFRVTTSHSYSFQSELQANAVPSQNIHDHSIVPQMRSSPSEISFPNHQSPLEWISEGSASQTLSSGQVPESMQTNWQSPLRNETSQSFQRDRSSQYGGRVSGTSESQSTYSNVTNVQGNYSDGNCVPSPWQYTPFGQQQPQATSSVPSDRCIFQRALQDSLLENDFLNQGIDIQKLLGYDLPNSSDLTTDCAKKPGRPKTEKEDDKKANKGHRAREEEKRGAGEREKLAKADAEEERRRASWPQSSRGRSRQTHNINLTDGYGECLLHYAVRRNDKDAVSFLLSHGADVNIKCRLSGDSPLHLAVKYNLPTILMILLNSAKVDLGIRNDAGQTFLDVMEEDSCVSRVIQEHVRTREMELPEIWEDASESLNPPSKPPHRGPQVLNSPSGKETGLRRTAQNNVEGQRKKESEEEQSSRKEEVPQISAWWYLFLPVLLAYCYSVMFCWA